MGMDPTKRITLLLSVDVGMAKDNYAHLLAPGEQVIYEFKGGRDFFLMTDRKVVLIDTKGITGKKKDVLALPYSKITAFSVESAGFMDFDAEMKLWASGIGLVELTFVKGAINITDVSKLLAEKVG